MTAKTLFIYINAGFSHRYLLRSNIFRTLKNQKNIRIVILSHNANEPGFREMYESDNIFVEVIKEDQYKSFLARNKLQRILIQLRAHILNGKQDTTTIDDFRSIFVIQNGWARSNGIFKYSIGKIFILLTEVFKKSRLLRKLLIVIEQWLFTPKYHQLLFEKYNPDMLLVTGLTGFLYNEFIAREAISHRVKVCNIVLSWDNTSGNGMPGFFPDHVIAWTETMKQELIELNDISEDIIHIGGVAHWDNYYDESNLLSKEDLFKKIEIDAHKKTIFYATKSPRRFPWGPHLIEEIAKQIEAKRFKSDAQLLVRIHPLHYRRVNGVYSFQDILNHYDEIEKKYSCIVLNKPETVSKEMDFDMADSETLLIASILKHSDLMINMFSTMAIEAAIFNLPIINMAIREICKGDIVNTKQDIMIDYRQTHNQRIIQSGGCRTSFTMNELNEYIDSYIQEPNEDEEGRRDICKNEAGPNPGNAGKDIGDIIINLLH